MMPADCSALYTSMSEPRFGRRAELWYHTSIRLERVCVESEEEKMVRILVVEDDEKLNKIVCTYLNDSGFQATGCSNARNAYDEMYSQLYDLIISDIMMPEIDGFEFARTVRKVNERIPILFMSAKDDLTSKQKGFRLGIDDYTVKPVDLDELVLRVRALLRRANIETERKIKAGNLTLDADGMSAEVDGEEISLTTREFNIIYKLLSYPKKTFSRAQLMDEFWDVDSDTSLRAVDVYMTKLRNKLSGCDGFKIVTVRGLGYKAAQICISHAFMIQDIRTSIGTFDVTEEDYKFMEHFVKNAVYDNYDRLVQLCDSLALPSGFCLLEKRFVDVALRYGTPPVLAERWRRTLEIRDMFEKKINGSIYNLLPGVEENTFR